MTTIKSDKTPAQMKDTTKPACDCLICKPVPGTISSEESLVHKNMAYYHFSNIELHEILYTLQFAVDNSPLKDSVMTRRAIKNIATINSILAARNSR